MPFSVVIPAYRSPQYLALCLESALQGEKHSGAQVQQSEYIVVYDGYFPLYQEVQQRFQPQFQERLKNLVFQQNQGLPSALNRGVWQAQYPWLLLLNEDNVLPLNWERRLEAELASDLVLSIEQIEPHGPSCYGFPILDLGQEAAQFNLQRFQEREAELAEANADSVPLADGRIFPFAIEKHQYMRVGGFDLAYASPHYCDFDFFLKLEMHPELRFARTRRLYIYHFGQKSTHDPDGSEAEKAEARREFSTRGQQARQLFETKWGITAVRGPDHSLLPRVRFQRGMRFQQRHEDLKIATMVNFCSNETKFIDRCLQEALKFSSQVVVPVCDHFFDGQPEDLDTLRAVASRHPEVHFTGFAFEASPHPPWYWPSLARVVGLRHLEPEIDWVLFLDADEIVEGDKLHAWLQRGDFRAFKALCLANYWYFRESRYRATQLEDSAVLIRRSEIQEAAIMDPMERIGIYSAALGPKQRYVKNAAGEVMVHHYSWVRSKAEMLRKVRAWSHREERDWESLVEAEFAQPFSGRDFIHGYTLEEVEPFFVAAEAEET